MFSPVPGVPGGASSPECICGLSAFSFEFEGAMVRLVKLASRKRESPRFDPICKATGPSPAAQPPFKLPAERMALQRTSVFVSSGIRGSLEEPPMAAERYSSDADLLDIRDLGTSTTILVQAGFHRNHHALGSDCVSI